MDRRDRVCPDLQGEKVREPGQFEQADRPVILDETSIPQASRPPLQRLLITSGLVAVMLVSLAFGLAWISAGFDSTDSWSPFLGVLVIAAGLLWLGWKTIQSDKQLSVPGWLAWLMVGAALLRLIAGMVWFVALPRWGYDSPVEQAGYVMSDAATRDQGAWRLSQSGKPLWTAFQDYPQYDQYGGLLFLSALLYRYLGVSSHYSLLIIVLTASFSALSVIFTWAFVRRLWSERTAAVAAWMVALFPEAVLLGSSHMREAFIITLAAAAFYGLVRFWQDRTWQGIAWVLAALVLSIPFSSAFTALLLIMLLILGLAFDNGRLLHSRWLWIAMACLAVAVLLGLWLSWKRFAPPGITDPLSLIGWWLQQTARWQAVFVRRASEMIRRVLNVTPEWIHSFLLIGVGVAQPFLPAALVDDAALIWRGIAIWRAVGWTLLLPLLIVAPLAAFTRKDRRAILLVLCLLVWWGILLAAFRSGGDLWDNPRYRVTFLAPQVALAAWVLTEQWKQPDPWLRRVVISFLLIMGWFLPWYLARYTGLDWPEVGVFKTLGLGLASAVLYLFWELTREASPPRKGEGTSDPAPGI
jgi:Dolichyl-phosphate-mannose-protein mannosyltransferase